MRIENIIFVEIKLYYVIIFYYSYFSISGRIFKKLKIALKEYFDDLEKRWFQSIRDNLLKNDSNIRLL